jgi:hypothetical protein
MVSAALVAPSDHMMPELCSNISQAAFTDS